MFEHTIAEITWKHSDVKQLAETTNGILKRLADERLNSELQRGFDFHMGLLEDTARSLGNQWADYILIKIKNQNTT